ncbi:CGNR zinc finger domain-containing protein [Streptomyces sp. NPDC060000]|uniref:CGNR zinc finger domain-containing protein n=1 Tax=Streptomyces sp. NPDC060000 TaxID=3347031 RepID=UPI00367A2880
MSVETPEPSIPSCLNRRPAVSMIRRLVSDLCSFPYRTTAHAPSPVGRTGCPSPTSPVYGIVNVIQRFDSSDGRPPRRQCPLRQGRRTSVGLSSVRADTDPPSELACGRAVWCRLSPYGSPAGPQASSRPSPRTPSARPPSAGIRRVRVCGAGHCALRFLGHSPAHNRRWCSTPRRRHHRPHHGPRRLRPRRARTHQRPLNAPDPNTFYGAGEAGYTDHPDHPVHVA